MNMFDFLGVPMPTQGPGTTVDEAEAALLAAAVASLLLILL
jgi:hypothetical protein